MLKINSLCVILFGIGLAGLLGIPQLIGAKRLKKEDEFDEDMSSYIRSLKVGGTASTVLGSVIVSVGLIFLFINC